MKYLYEVIKYDPNLPAKIELNNMPGSAYRGDLHWHKEIEILFLIDGELTVTKNNIKNELHSDDVFVINSGEIHGIDAEDGDKTAELLSVYLSFDFVKKFDGDLDLFYFQTDRGTGAEQRLKDLLRQLAEFKQTDEQEFPSVKQYALLMDIIHVLFTSCRRQKQISLYGSCSVSFRNAKVAMEYIEEHFREELNLNIMAELVGLNPIYFSKYFKDSTGMGFNAYVNSVRMKHAIDDLVNHNLTIADAARANGFQSVKSFEAVCKRNYGLTPLQIKKARHQQIAG